jgi:predicted aconitase
MIDLSQKEKDMRDGKEGPLLKFAMSLVLKAADIWQAPKLIEASFAHIDACHYYGQAHLDFARKLEREGATFPIPSWTNTVPVSLTASDGREENNQAFVDGAKEVAEIYERIGCKPVWTCAPYQLPDGPKFGDQIVGSESNAVSFYNAVVGARTQKYGDFLDVACALTGRVPFTGLHRDESRIGQIELDVSQLPEALRQEEEICHLIGIIMGRDTGSKVPVIRGLPSSTHRDSLKGIAAAGAASGGVAMFHVLGVTPEAPDAETAYQGRTPERIQKVTVADLDEAKALVSSVRSGPVNMVALGTPHFSYDEFQRLAVLIDGRKVHPDVTFYVSTSRFVAQMVQDSGAMDIIERAGVQVLRDTCTYFSPAVKACNGTVMTNSGKWAFYAPGMLPVDVAFGSLRDCVQSALKGEIVVAPAFEG